jgi:hypothetical protein
MSWRIIAAGAPPPSSFRTSRAPAVIVQNLARPGRRAIDAGAATKSILETLGIFAEVMQNAGKSDGLCRPEYLAARWRGARRRSDARPGFAIWRHRRFRSNAQNKACS